MVVLDIILLIIIVAAMVRGWQLGFIRQGIIVAGLFLGFWLAVVLMPLLVPLLTGLIGRTLASLVIFGVSILLLGSLFDWLAHLAKKQLKKHHCHQIDGGIGIVFGAVYAAILIWLFANVFMYGPTTWLPEQVKGSVVIRTIDQAMPNPPSALVSIRRYIANIRLPQPFVGNEPAPERLEVDGSTADLQAIMAKTEKSVVAISGTACSSISVGSGFVAAPDVVVTNAHVVAGVARPIIQDDNGRHSATVIYFNPDLDIALLRTSNLAGPVLPMNTTVQPRGTAGAVIGYPRGGSLTGVSGYVLQSITAVGRNIYNEGLVRRDVYTLKTDVQPGNSGGPYVLASGEVAGVVFARSESYANTGYAIQSGMVAPIVAEHKNAAASVSTRSCSR